MRCRCNHRSGSLPGRKGAIATTSPIAISRLGQTAINVHDFDRATAVYKDIPGLPLMFDIGSLVFFDCGGVRLMLTHPEKPEFDYPAPFCTLSTSLSLIGKC